MNKNVMGHLTAIITIVIWGVTFICTKLLLEHLNPFSIMFYRFLLAYIILLVAYPKRQKTFVLKEELKFLLAGFSGVTLYLLLENTAISFSTASNVGLIVSSGPMFTAVAFSLFYKAEKIGKPFFIGFVIAFAGIFLVMFSGQGNVSFNPIGDILALLAAMSWGAYSLFYRKAADFNTDIILITRKTFFYGLLTMLPLTPFFDLSADFSVFTDASVLFNFFFLGALASSMCYVSWSYACNVLGSVKTSAYIYLIPFISLLASAIVLGEKITFIKLAGCVLILAGVYISSTKKQAQNKTTIETA
ncbi:MAG: DMT family transporter [Clostridiales bacterium]|nr:DMT family transporter [Clostridiales bacterium]